MEEKQFKEWLKESERRSKSWEWDKEEEEERAFHEVLNYITDMTNHISKEEQDDLINNITEMYLYQEQLEIMKSIIATAKYTLVDITKECNTKNYHKYVYSMSKLIFDMELWVKNCMVLEVDADGEAVWCEAV